MTGQNNESEKAAGRAVISTINQVEGFDPEPFAVDYVDLEDGGTRKRLPVMIQMAWFRLKYPQGKIAVKVAPGKDCFIATARIYPDYKDDEGSYLAEATASRGFLADKPSVSPREWAQTAAVGIALRNAGVGLQFGMAGEEVPAVAPDELGLVSTNAEQTGTGQNPGTPLETGAEQPEVGMTGGAGQENVPASVVPQAKTEERELSYEKKLQRAFDTPCPIKKYAGKTLGDLLTLDPNALKWVATKFQDENGVHEAAQLICEYAMQQASA